MMPPALILALQNSQASSADLPLHTLRRIFQFVLLYGLEQDNQQRLS